MSPSTYADSLLFSPITFHRGGARNFPKSLIIHDDSHFSSTGLATEEDPGVLLSFQAYIEERVQNFFKS